PRQSPSTTDRRPLTLHDALPIWRSQVDGLGQCLDAPVADPGTIGLRGQGRHVAPTAFALDAGRTLDDDTHVIRTVGRPQVDCDRSEEHTSELQSPDHLVCRLLLE